VTAAVTGEQVSARDGFAELRALWLAAMIRTGRRGLTDEELLAEAERVHDWLRNEALGDEATFNDPAAANAIVWEIFEREPHTVKWARRQLRRQLAETALRRGRAVTAAEIEAEELNHCSVLMGVIHYWRAERGKVVRDREAEEQEWRIELAFRELDRRESWRRALASRGAGIIRPLIRVHTQGRARRGRRVTLRRASRASPSREPDPPKPLVQAAA
jgi:hypothetical protein